ncbi:MAG: radical SAM protein, partial [Phycisphaerae bacterium]
MKVAFVYMNNERNVGRGAACVAASVLRAGHELAFFDTYFVSLRQAARRIADGGFDVLMVSSMTMLFPEALCLMRLVRRRRHVPTLLGGIHATVIGAPLLDRHPEIDYLCIGEGESMAVAFMDGLAAGDLGCVPNLVWRRDGRPCANPVGPAETLADLAPFPWHLFPRESVVLPDTGFLYASATRGCPFNCTYCANGVYLRHYGKAYLRFRPIDQVVAELAYLKRAYRPRLFYFGDEMILSDPGRAVDLFRAVRREVQEPFGCMARVEYMTPEIVREMADAGCQYVAMGVECGDEAFRRRHLRRLMSNDQIQCAFALAKDAGLFVTSFNMIGYPFPNDDELTEATVLLNEKLRPDYVQTSIFYPFPGTALHDHCVERDLIDPAKRARATDYFKESVLRGVTLHGKVKEIQARLNPQGFRFEVRRRPA